MPKPLFSDPHCTILNAKNSELLSAKIASDGQWRFPKAEGIPYKFKESILYFEDEYFNYHLGINPISIFKAAVQNIKAKKIVRGGSTITLQLIRMSRKGKARTYREKLIECFLALRLELSRSKEEILVLYSTNAPFGGNVVGLEAAAWRYYGRGPELLSWGETATLAVLPNAPSLIYPGSRQALLLKKRNRLLNKLQANKVIDETTCELAKTEPLPTKPNALPQITPHLLDRAIKDGYEGVRIQSTINKHLQTKCMQIVDNHYKYLSQNEIHNAAAIVVDVETGNCLAYVGNTSDPLYLHSNQVDIITSNRSSGSILKPFLYALMLNDGIILPTTLIPDVPTQIAGYSPKNFDKKYDGAVHANNALARSLNVPAIRMLRDYGIEVFCDKLKKLKISTINKSADHYGLSVILGGAEVNLWELTGAYSSMARSLNNYSQNMSRYNSNNYQQPQYINRSIRTGNLKLYDDDFIGAGPIWHTFEALTDMNRPVNGANWKLFSSSQKIAWKTGTSFGHRDAWAVGVNPKYVVGVWVGNADGEGRPGLTGASMAAPILFDIFKFLPKSQWFEIPYDDLIEIPVCRISGHKSTAICTPVDTLFVPNEGYKTSPCPYHTIVHLNQKQNHRVTSECYSVSQIVNKSWFVLPPVMEWYYKMVNPYYSPLPAMHPACSNENIKNLDLVYPKPNAKLFIPKGLDELKQRIVFEAVYRTPNVEIHWHLDHEYLGSTNSFHQMDIYASEGNHTLTLISESGEELIRNFQIISR